MKRHLALPLASLLAGVLLAVPALAADGGCAAKREAILQRIEAAKAQGNSAQQAGLEKALAEVKANCTEASLRQERENKVAEQRDEVAEREADLREAQAHGDAQKIAKRQAKLDEARAELKAAEQALQP
ncbi:DUF1090 domain-containing protein [Metapseudomonas resinovorans]|uniref:Protein YqjC n=1 Tax=Metapseudomonas resinovorans NBRC 106553 TaxID=1245471 RepID=S6BAM2_METRE|nr:DUF1090 domain-containing protein [Pseudomonas resinovorans]BAN46099.1 hypothetical protein PCA10_03670 [Pseudomonas resinovorans NBRC 106553]